MSCELLASGERANLGTGKLVWDRLAGTLTLQWCVRFDAQPCSQQKKARGADFARLTF